MCHAAHARFALQVTPEEIGSQVALEYGQAMTVRVRRVDAPEAPMRKSRTGRVGKGGAPSCGRRGNDQLRLPAAVVVVQSASVLELKKALRRFVQLRQERQGGARHISW